MSSENKTLLKAFLSIPPADRLKGFIFFCGTVIVTLIAFQSGVNSHFVLLSALAFLLIATFLLFPKKAYAQSTDSVEDSSSTEFKFDVFISSPMDSFDCTDALEKSNSVANNVRLALRRNGVAETIFHAGSERPTKIDYEMPHQALVENFKILSTSDRFVFIMPENLPSSALVEVGAALAYKKPSVWFFKKGFQPPYLIRDGSAASNRDGIPNISVYEYETTEEIYSLIDQHKSKIFKAD